MENYCTKFMFFIQCTCCEIYDKHVDYEFSIRFIGSMVTQSSIDEINMFFSTFLFDFLYTCALFKITNLRRNH